jgi:hypothetical protein
MADSTLSASELEFVVSADIRSRTPRPIGETFHRVITALNNAGVQYVLAGAMARGLYAPARFTEGIELIALEGARSPLARTLADAGLKCEQGLSDRLTFIDPDTQIDGYVLLVNADPDKSAVEDHTTAVIFNTSTSAIKPEYLLWRWCLSDVGQDRSDAIALIKGGKVDMKKLNKHLMDSRDQAAQQQLQLLSAQAEKEKKSSYSDSVVRRLRKKGR